MSQSRHLVCFAHGKESGPWGTKISHLAETARRCGFDVLSPDYSHTHDPDRRIQQLLELAPSAQQLVLVGSSMGGYVSAHACKHLQASALFLMAPALYFEGWDTEPEGVPAHCTVVHGWHDDIVPVERSIRFSRTHRAQLHILDSDHGLNDQLQTLDWLLTRQLQLLTEYREDQ